MLEQTAASATLTLSLNVRNARKVSIWTTPVLVLLALTTAKCANLQQHAPNAQVASPFQETIKNLPVFPVYLHAKPATRAPPTALHVHLDLLREDIDALRRPTLP